MMVPRRERMLRRLRSAKALRRLISFYNGEIELSKTQAAVGMFLVELDPDLPKVKATDVNITLDQRHIISAEPLTEEQWVAKYGDMGATSRTTEKLS